MRLRDVVRERGLWLLAALIAALFWRPLISETFFFRDLYLLIYPKKLFLATAIRAGEIPLWDPYTNGGQPYLASPANFAFHPTNLLYLILPPIVAFNWILVLHVVACAAFAYWLARTIGLSATAACITGAIYALCGFTLSSLNLMPWILGLPWIPLTIGLLHRALRDDRSIAPVAIAAAMPFYGGAAEVAVILFVTMIVWTLLIRGSLRRVTIAILFTFAIGALPMLPATSVIAQSSRRARQSYGAFTSWSVHPRRLPELIVPRYFGPTDTLDDRDYWGRAFETDGFPYVLSIYFGVPVMILAIAGARSHKGLALFAGIALLLSLGKWLPGFRLFYDVPLIATFRYPVKAIAAALLPVAILAGYGVESIARRFATFAAIAGAMIASVAVGLAPAPLARSLAHTIVFAVAFAAAAWLPRRREVAMAAIVALDLAIGGAGVNVFAPRSIFDEPPIASTVRSLIGGGRFYAAPRPIVLRAPTNELFWLARWQIATLNGYTAAMFRIPVIYHADYDGLAPWRIARMSDTVNRLPWPQRLPLLDRGAVTVFTTIDSVPLPEAGALPEARLHLYVNRAAQTARFVGPCAGPVRMVTRRLNAAAYEVDTPCDGTVVLSEALYDGWRTRVDGADASVLPADFAFTGVPVKKGKHTIERSYFPPRLLAGALVTAISLLLLAIFARRTARKAATSASVTSEIIRPTTND
ncbi:MAG: YfhO family protein [Acidobacteriota bacterium]|nr:YfhO family protein [Acidobacteriota bacterium]